MAWNTKRLLILLLLLTIALPTFSEELKEDRKEVEVRKPSETTMKEYYNDSDYVYGRIPPPPKTWWQRFRAWLSDKIYNSLNFEGSGTFWKILQYLLVAAAIVAALLLVFKSGLTSIFKGNPAKVDKLDFTAIEENIHGVDFDKLITECESNKDYRKAVRLYYLKYLKQLSDSDTIEWKPEKTNYDYFLELSGKNIQQTFGNLSKWYEYIWYGNFEVEKEKYAQVVVKFKQANTHHV